MISADWTLFLQMANLILLILVLNVALYKPIRKILKERKQKIQGLEAGISGAQQKAVDSGQAFKAKMSDARMQGVQKKEALKLEAENEQKKILDELNKKAQQELKNVKAQIAKDAQEARKKLQSEVKAFAGAVAEKILGRAVS